MKKLILTLILASISQFTFGNTSLEDEKQYQKLLIEYNLDFRQKNIEEFKKLACSGHVKSQVRLAEYKKDRDTYYKEERKLDKYEAMFWLTEAVERGDKKSLLELSAYAYSEFERTSFEAGYKWLYIFNKLNNSEIEKTQQEKDFSTYALKDYNEKINSNKLIQLQEEADKWKPSNPEKIINCELKLKSFIETKINLNKKIKSKKID